MAAGMTTVTPKTNGMPKRTTRSRKNAQSFLRFMLDQTNRPDKKNISAIR